MWVRFIAQDAAGRRRLLELPRVSGVGAPGKRGESPKAAPPHASSVLRPRPDPLPRSKCCRVGARSGRPAVESGRGRKSREDCGHQWGSERMAQSTRRACRQTTARGIPRASGKRAASLHGQNGPSLLVGPLNAAVFVMPRTVGPVGHWQERGQFRRSHCCLSPRVRCGPATMSPDRLGDSLGED